jgi:uncharacterized protein (DUF1778 family)
MAPKSEFLQIRVTPTEKATLKRLARAADQDVSSYVLARALPSAQGRFEDLLRSLAESEDHRFVLAELNDFLTALAPVEAGEAIAYANLDRLSPFLANYVSAMAEQAADTKGIPVPLWVRRVPPLTRPYFAAPLPGLRLHLMHASPVPFKKRNLFVDAALGARV